MDGRKLIEYMKAQGFAIWALNICYLVGANAETWEPIDNVMDAWNDVRIVVRHTGEVMLSNQATTDPGTYYTDNPMNPEGCAIIALGNHKDGWSLGLHRGMPALVQTGEVKIYRDIEGNGLRRGTIHRCRDRGINQHGCGGRNGGISIGRWSAGCAVGKYWNSHMKFYNLCKDSGRTTFDSTFIDSMDFAKFA